MQYAKYDFKSVTFGNYLECIPKPLIFDFNDRIKKGIEFINNVYFCNEKLLMEIISLIRLNIDSNIITVRNLIDLNIIKVNDCLISIVEIKINIDNVPQQVLKLSCENLKLVEKVLLKDTLNTKKNFTKISWQCLPLGTSFSILLKTLKECISFEPNYYLLEIESMIFTEENIVNSQLLFCNKSNIINDLIVIGKIHYYNFLSRILVISLNISLNNFDYSQKDFFVLVNNNYHQIKPRNNPKQIKLEILETDKSFNCLFMVEHVIIEPKEKYSYNQISYISTEIDIHNPSTKIKELKINYNGRFLFAFWTLNKCVKIDNLEIFEGNEKIIESNDLYFHILNRNQKNILRVFDNKNIYYLAINRGFIRSFLNFIFSLSSRNINTNNIDSNNLNNWNNRNLCVFVISERFFTLQ